MVSTFGLMDANMSALGSTTRCTAAEHTPGTTAEHIPVSTLMTKMKDKAYLSGLTAESTKACGRKEKLAEKEE